MERGARNMRFALYFQLHSQYMGEIPGTAEAIKFQTEKSNLFIYENELDKFHETYPEVDRESFLNFLTTHNALKRTGKKKGSGGVRSTHIDTPEKATQIGLTGEAVNEYVSRMQTVKTLINELNVIVKSTGCTVQVAVKNPVKAKVQTE